MDRQIIRELVKTLDQEAKFYEELLNISKNKTNIIVEGKVAELEKLTRLEQSLVLQVGKLEAKREELVDKTAAQLGIDPAQMTISELLAHLDGEELRLLARSRSNMDTVLQGFKNSNDLNMRLIKNSLDFINFSINLMTDTGSGKNVYSLNGQTAEGKKRNFFDRRL